MSDERQPEEVYREILEVVLEGIKKAKSLMESENEETVKFALKYLNIMTDYALALVQVLEEDASVVENRNPLARRARLDD